MALGLAAVTLLYLAGMNVFLRTRLFRSVITSDSGSLRIDYVSAYSLVPGRIHVEGLTIRGRDSSVEWILAIDRCDFRQSFFDLLRRRFHADHVRGSGLSMRVRQRVQKVTPAAAALPPVPGFLDPPLADVGPPPPPLTDAQYRLWSVQLDDVVAEHVRELWIDTVRTTGDLRVEGRWFFRPLRWLDIGPAALDLRSMNVFDGADVPVGLDVHGTMVLTVHPVDLRDLDGNALLDHVACDADLHGALLAGPLIESIDGEPDGKGSGAAWAIEPAAVHLVAEHAASTVVIDVPQAEVVRHGPMSAILPMPDGLDLDVKRATASVHAEVDIASRSASGHLRMKAPNLKLRTGNDVMTGTLEVELEAKARDSVVDLSGTTAAFTSGTGADASNGAGWWARIRLADARLNTGGGALQFRAQMSATAKDASPVSAFLAKVTPLPRWLLDAVPTSHLRIAGEIRARPSVFEVRSVQARADGSSVDFEFEKLANWKEWALLLEAGPVHAGVRSGDGGTEVVLFNAQRWFKEQASAFRTNASRGR